VYPKSSGIGLYAAGGIANFSLGLPSDRPPANSLYWIQVREALRTALDSYFDRGHELRLVLSHGENAHNEIFDAVLREEVLAVQSDDPPKDPIFSNLDPVFAAARGAAASARYCFKKRGSCFPDLHPIIK